MYVEIFGNTKRKKNQGRLIYTLDYEKTNEKLTKLTTRQTCIVTMVDHNNIKYIIKKFVLEIKAVFSSHKSNSFQKQISFIQNSQYENKSFTKELKPHLYNNKNNAFHLYRSGLHTVEHCYSLLRNYSQTSMGQIAYINAGHTAWILGDLSIKSH